jgi:predicted transcriptional regulator
VNFNVYLNSTLVEALKRLAKRRKMTRNALIRKAVEDLVAQEGQSKSWSPAVLDWQGDAGFEPFEFRRVGLRKPTEDPLA